MRDLNDQAKKKTRSSNRRDEEIRRIIQVLSRRTKTILIIGDPGVGKTGNRRGSSR